MAREDELTRRGFLYAATTGAAAVACGGGSEPVTMDDEVLEGRCSEPEPASVCEPTAADIEGPFYLPDSPERSDLDTVGDEGITLVIRGQVRDADCAPLGGTIVEIWHADPAGDYDNGDTYNYRGWVRADGDGVYTFRTLMPGRYPNAGTLRPAHVHVKAWREGAEALTTQLYFEGDPYLEGDTWAEPARTVCLEEEADAFIAVFDLVLA